MSDRVSVGEWAPHVGVAPQTALDLWRSHGLDVQDDWAGRPSLSEQDAGRLRAAIIEARTTQEREHQDREREAEAERERMRARERTLMERVQERMSVLHLIGPQSYAAASIAVQRVRAGEDEDQVVDEVVTEARRSVQVIAAGVR